MNDSIAAVVVTYNRLNFLKEIIFSLKIQSKKINKIIVVNNDSNDGTSEWLNEQNDLIVINQGNVGGAGGFHTGVKAAYEMGFEWIWIMDDDVVPDLDCLKFLFEKADKNKILTPIRIQPDGSIFYNDIYKFNFTNPFKSLWTEIISEKHFVGNMIKVEGITFEGPFFNRNIVKNIGFPEKKFFIFADDSEYSLRATKAGFEIYLVQNAKLYRKLNYIDPLKNDFNWKHYFIFRNLFALHILYGNLLVRYLRPFAFLILWITFCKKFKDIKTLFKAFIDGYFYKRDKSSFIN